ncbi:MarR family transcriptional regulator [Actinospica durhamensis]|uniref:MarR family transcriptional regulator n=1 Tax=Actinospica durhamensis TaxID=1508375 RepID=A0A941ERY3_9ACTN|nr:MarR family transcriptional regulator [Actinospica durhamensis]MBR7835398.1 MarR family transcriptional regulator [Actinospica durhamensis]
MTVDPPPPLDRGLAEDLSTSLSALNRTVRRHVRSHLHFEPLAGAQGELLRLVVERPGISVSAAAKELRLAANSVSTQVQQLARLGYLSREASPADRRGAVLRATADGQERLARWADERAELFARQLHRLSGPDLDALTAALPALRALAEAISTDETDLHPAVAERSAS